MWHEARKQEKKIRGLLVDYQRRAQRRKDYYEKIVSLICVVLCNANRQPNFLPFRKLIQRNSCNCTGDNAKYTLIQALQLLPIALLLCKLYIFGIQSKSVKSNIFKSK